MSKHTVASLAARMERTEGALATLVASVTDTNANVAALLARLEPTAPAALVTPAAPAPEAPAKVTSEEFVAWIRETAPARKARKESNGEMAAWMRSKGIQPRGAAWEACKAGERGVKALKALNADLA